MKQRNQYLMKNTIIFAIGNFGTKMISFFLVPLYTNLLSTGEYGIVDLILTIGTVLIPFLTFNIADGIMRFALDKDADYTQITGIGIIMMIFSTAAIFLLMPFFRMTESLKDYSGLGLSVKELMERGVKIGADVPYCLLRGTALAEGIGDKLRALPACPDCYVLIGKPAISVSTKFVYENLHANELEYHPEIDKMLDAIQWHNLNKIADCMGNVLETVTIPHYPVIQKIKDHMKEHGALNAMMSGSGPTVFGLFDDKATAENACEALRESRLARTVFLTTVFNNGGRRK